MNDEALDEAARLCHEAIRFHREQYEKAIEPLIKKLAMIEGFRKRTIVLPLDSELIRGDGEVK